MLSKATLCHFFTLKEQLQSDFGGTVSCNRLNDVSVSATPPPHHFTNFCERVGSQCCIHVYFKFKFSTHNIVVM